MEAEVLLRVNEAREKTKSWPKEDHWFCPAYGNSSVPNLSNPDEAEPGWTVAAKRDRIAAASKRLAAVQDRYLIFGLDKNNHGEEQKRFKEGLKKQLECYDCMRKYHESREDFLSRLLDEYGKDIAEQFSEVLDKNDFERIDKGLMKGKEILDKTPSVERHYKVLDTSALQAISEVLCCENYHTNEDRLSVHFNDVFNMVQENKILKLAEVLPATTSFLFDKDPVRRKFARSAWERTEKVSRETFDWAVKKGLVRSMPYFKANQTLQDLQRFWGGMLLILQNLDRPLLSEVLKGLDGAAIDIRNFLISCFSCKSGEVFSLLVKAYCVIIEKCPKDFYEAFSGASPWSVVEQILKSPSFPSALSEYNPDETDGATSWCLPFIRSLGLSQQSDACDSLLHHFFEQLQNNQALDEDAKALCFKAGLVALAETVKGFFAPDVKLSGLTTRIYIQHVLKLVNRYKEPIFMCAALQDPEQKELARLAMTVIRETIRLDSKVIKVEYDMIEAAEKEWEDSGKTTLLQVHIAGDSIQIWNLVKDAFTTGSMDMAKNFLMGMAPLIEVNPCVIRVRQSPIVKDMKSFNNSYEELCSVVADLFMRISDLKESDLRELLYNQATAYAMYGALVSANEEISGAMNEVLKNYTHETNRKEALAKVLHERFAECVSGICWGIKQVSSSESFAAMPHLLAVSGEMRGALCDTNGGVLRERHVTPKEQGLVKLFWKMQWTLMKTLFSMLETWSTQPGSNKKQLADFARDVMDHANALFDEYPLLKSTLKASENHTDDLLSSVVKTMDHMVKWLRLKDTYLATQLANLICKILRRLGDDDIVLDPKSIAVGYMRDVAAQGLVRTNLTHQEKAEMRRALDQNQGFEILDEPHRMASKKQSKLDTWSKSADGTKRDSSSSRTKDVFSSLTPGLNSHRDRLDRMKNSDRIKNSSSAEARRKAAETKTAVDKAFMEKRQASQKEQDRARRAAAAAARGSLSVPGEGSGIRGIGVQGKDHTPKTDSIMVDSESDEEDEEDEEDVKLLLRGKPSAFNEIEADRKKKQIQGPVIIKKQARSAKDMRARLSPNMDPLHQTILNWDFFHQGETPPDTLECQKIANKFNAAHEYKNTMYPLLVSEAWKDLVTVRDESKNGKSKPFDIKIVNRMSVDNYIEITTSIFYKEMRDQDISDGSIVLLSQGNDPLRDDQAPNCLARVFKVARNQHNKEKMDISYRVSNRVKSKLITALTPNAEIRGVMLTAMTTIEREFAALHSLEYYDLCDEILNAIPSPLLNYSDAAITPIERNYKVNKAQAKAILSAKQNDAFTLVQGPPGSGKTKTIVAMVGAILTNVLSLQGTAITRPGSMNASVEPKAVPKKLLICAPSNAAVDEIVSRLKAGVKTMKGDFKKINVLRIGRLATINPNVQDVSLDKQINAQLEGSGEENKAMLEEQAKREKLHRDAGELKVVVDSLKSQLDEARSSGNKAREEELRRDLDGKKRIQASLGSQIEISKSSGNIVGRNKDIKRRELQQKLISQAHVVCATLSGSGHDMFKGMEVEFETVIIDEAAQCIELSALIPLKYGCSKCILVGDPKQLPPTVLSKMAANFGYEQSLFVRMQKNHPKDIHLLDTQYRMHPDISAFPSQQFYDGKLVDGNDMKALRKQPWHSSSLLGPYRFFDVKGNQQRGQGHSLMNTAEIKVAMQLYQRVTSDYRGIDWKGKIGIITPYKAQLFQLRAEFQRQYGDVIFDQIEFNTTDAFQGREAEVIIFSCVRAQASGGVGFLNDIRRMNVGLTRAKASLWVLGDSRSLMQGSYWNKLINDAQERGLYTDGDVMSLLSKPTADPQAASAPFNRGTLGGGASAEPAGDSTSAAQIEMEDSMRRSSIQDVEMTDLPAFPGEHPIRKTSSVAAHAANQQSAIQGDIIHARQSRLFGGKTCSVCGSHDHDYQDCDNQEMINRQRGCYRCGDFECRANRCTKERCLNCGEFGHTNKYCTSPSLPFEAKRKLENQEARFTRDRITYAERKQKQSEAGHDPKIPPIKASAVSGIPGLNTPRSSLNNNKKRQRPSSPSDDMANKKIPTGPRTMDGPPERQRTSSGSSQRPTASDVPNSTAPKGPRSMQPGQSVSNGSRPGPSNQDNRRPPQPMPVRRKKPAADPFIRPKPRR